MIFPGLAMFASNPQSTIKEINTVYTGTILILAQGIGTNGYA